MDGAVKELVVICVISLLSLAVAWEFEADYFAMFFAGAAALSVVEAVRRSLKNSGRGVSSTLRVQPDLFIVPAN